MLLYNRHERSKEENTYSSNSYISELENFIDIFSITGLALLDKYQLHTTINIVVLTGYLKFLDIFKEIVLITKRL